MNRYSKALRILSPKGQVEDKPLMAVKIVKGEYYSRPVMEKEIKEYIKKTFKKSNQYRYRKDDWLETLVEEKEIEFDRKEIEKEIKLRRLYEQMTTKGMMMTTISGEGETDLDSLDGSVAASYSPLSGEDSAFVDTAITGNGTGSGSDGGFDLGQDYLAFNGEGSPRYAVLDPIDSTEIDTIVITAIRGNDANGGEDPDAENEDLTVWYQIGDGTPTKIGIIIPVGSDDSGLKNWSLAIPAAAQNAAAKFILRQETHHGVGFDNYGVTEVKFQRRAPMNVFVSLDSPEAVSFIRTGGDEEKDKKKKVQDILDGSDAYLENQFGSDFPGTSPKEVGQEEPQPGIGKFEPEVIDYETWKNELEKSDDPEVKKILKGDPKKTFDKFVDDNPELAAQSVLNDILNGKSVENQLSQLPQEVQDIIISKTVESVLIGEVNVELSQLPQEVQDVLITNPEYMTNERIDNLVNDDKMVGDILSSMWEKDEKLFNNVATEVGELPYHQNINELENILSGTKYKGDEGFVDYGSKSNQVLSNMSQLDQNRYGPLLELQQDFYGPRDSDAPSDWRFNYAYGRDYDSKTGMSITPPSASGSNYHDLRDKQNELKADYYSYYKPNSFWEKYPGAGENAIETRSDYQEYEKLFQDFKDLTKKLGGTAKSEYSYQITGKNYTGPEGTWEKAKSDWNILWDKVWGKYDKAEKEHGALQDAAFDKYQKLKKETDAKQKEHNEKVDALRARLDAEYERNKAKIEKAVEGSMDIFMQDFMKMFIMQYSGNMSSDYSFGGSDLPDILSSTTTDDSKPSSEPWSMDMQVGDERIIKTGKGQSSTTVLDTQRGIGNNKPQIPQDKLGGSLGDVTDVDAATAASTAAQTQQKDKGKNNILQNIQDWDNAASRALRSFTDNARYAGDTMWQGGPSTRPPGVSNYWSPDPTTAAGYSNPGGGYPGAKPNPSGTLAQAPRPANTPGVSRSPLGQPQFKFQPGTTVDNFVASAADDVATAAAEKVALKGATKLGRIVPGVAAAIAVVDVTTRMNNGDYLGAALGGMSAVPGPLGWLGLGLQVTSDLTGMSGGDYRESYSSYEEYLNFAKTEFKKIKAPEDPRGYVRAALESIKDNKDLTDDDKTILTLVLSGDTRDLEAQDLQKVIVHLFDLSKNSKTKKESLSHTLKGNPLIEKKKFDAVEPKEHKSGSMRIKSPKQFFNPADVKPEFPKDPPPEMVNGYHPKLADGQEIANRFNKLDPHSAEAMPKTGNPHIDAKVEKAKNNPDKDGPEWRKMVDAKARKARLQRG